jgi:predicted amidohydrolase YtcJ
VAHLYRGGRILSPNSRPLTALLIEDGCIAWIGDDAEASGITRAGMRITDLDGALVTSGFVDAHVHATSTGLTLLDLDLAHTCSALDVLEAVEKEASRHPGSVILGHGWDESQWSDSSLPIAQEIDRASNGARVYLTRVDAHSALVSTALMAAVPGVGEMNGFDSSGWVMQEAHHALRKCALESLSQATRARAQHAFLAEAARKGIVSVHEMAGPVISSEADCRLLLSAADDLGGTRVVAYWGELAQLGGIELASDLGARGTGGDLFVDGSLGSHTACLHEPYVDAPHTSGREFIDHDTLAEHVDLCVRAGQQTGFHAIGDAATEAVVTAYTRAAEIHGPELVCEVNATGLSTLKR